MMVPCKDHGRKGMPRGYTTGRINLPDGTVHKTTLHRAVFYEAHGYLPEFGVGTSQVWRSIKGEQRA